MKNDLNSRASSLPQAAPERVTVAYHAGPPEIGFYNRAWTRGAPQTIPADDWAAMRARVDFHEFDFEEEN